MRPATQRFRAMRGPLAAALLAAGVAHAATVPPGYSVTLLASGISLPTAMEIAPDGRVFVLEQQGAVRVIKQGVLLATPFVTLSVDSTDERGLLGIAFDPSFASNGFVYLYYTTPTSAHNRIVRVTANGDVAVGGSMVTLLDLDPLVSTSHNGGAIHFGIDGKLYVAVGDNVNGTNSQTLSTLLGKMLRINSDGSLPADNPFAGSPIWALGLRNPFTFAVDRSTGLLLINDVGESSWEEIDVGIAGANYGWPDTEGPTNDPRFRGPLFAYTHADGCAITGGTFFEGRYMFADLCGGWIYALDTQHPATATPFATQLSNPVDLKTGPDGALYYLERDGGNVGFIVGPSANVPLPTWAFGALALLVLALGSRSALPRRSRPWPA